MLAFQRASTRAIERPRHRRHRYLFRDGIVDRLLSERPIEHQRRVLHGRARNDAWIAGLSFVRPTWGLWN